MNMVANVKSKQSKGERQQAMAAKMKGNADLTAAGLTPAVPALKPKVVAPVAQKDDKPAGEPATPKKKRVFSSHHLNWKALPDFPHEQRIVVLSAENPKKRGSAARFELYKRGPEGMTVGEYIEASAKAGNTKALAKEDIKWDFTGGFISVDGKKAPANIRASK